MALRTSRDLPATRPHKDQERDTQKAIIKDADKTEGKDRDSVHGDGGPIDLVLRYFTARRITSAHGGTITAPTISAIARPAAPRISANMLLPSRRGCRPIRSAIFTRAAPSAAWSSMATRAGSWTGNSRYSLSFRDALPLQRRPGIHTPCRGYGFRARPRKCALAPE